MKIEDHSRLIDHTNLKSNASEEQMALLCKEALEYSFCMVAINQVQTRLCANLENVRLMRPECDPQIQVKAAGGIRDVGTFLAMIEAGATGIGTSSDTKIIEDLQKLSLLGGK